MQDFYLKFVWTLKMDWVCSGTVHALKGLAPCVQTLNCGSQYCEPLLASGTMQGRGFCTSGFIADRGQRVRGDWGLSDTTKKQSWATSFLQGSPLSVKWPNLFMWTVTGVGSARTEAKRLQVWVVGKEFGTTVRHPLNEEMEEKTDFNDKWFHFPDPDVGEPQCDFKSLSSGRETTGKWLHF